MEFIREVPKIVVTEAPSKEKPVVLECELSRKPKEQVKWLHNGKPLPSRLPKGVTVEEEKQSTIHRITFTELTDEDLGEYTAQVEKIASTGGVEMKGGCVSCFTHACVYVCVDAVSVTDVHVDRDAEGDGDENGNGAVWQH